MYKTAFPGVLSKGMKNLPVRYLQEWLSIHGFGVVPDGDFGDATFEALLRFQLGAGLSGTGICDASTWHLLEVPLITATTIKYSTSNNLPAIILQVANRHLEQHPREIGGQNMGPWVRYYTKGHEGVSWPWCAAFVSSIIEQAFITIKLPPYSFHYTCSCDMLMQHAIKYKRRVDKPYPGCIFIKRGNIAGDWTHTGLVLSVTPATFTTIEGNSNDKGSREGVEVCSITRSLSGPYDFIKVDIK